jgi:glutamate carboxypeptidase
LSSIALCIAMPTAAAEAAARPESAALPDAAALTPTEARIVEWVDTHVEDAIALLGRAVDIPSSTANVEGVRRVGDLFAAELAAIGLEPRWEELPPELLRAGHLFAERRGSRGKRLLLIGHLDTVLEGGPFRRDGDVGWGIGASDMKGGDVVLLYALKALHAAGALEDTQVVVALIGDEEEAARPLDVARAALVAAARESDVALGFEGAAPGVAVVGRRGIGSWRLTTSGTTGHSSQIFTDGLGYGAIFEVARILDRFRAELAGEEYLTFNPSVVVGGSTLSYDAAMDQGSAQGRTNVVPDEAVVEGDIRYLTPEQQRFAAERMATIAAGDNLHRTRASFELNPGYPPMAPTAGNYQVLAMLDQVSRDLGYGAIAPHDPRQRGAADISFVAPYVPGIDGLGAMGAREHAPDEHVRLDAFPMLIGRAALLIHRLLELPREAELPPAPEPLPGMVVTE